MKKILDKIESLKDLKQLSVNGLSMSTVLFDNFKATSKMCAQSCQKEPSPLTQISKTIN